MRSGLKENLKKVHQKYLCPGHTQMEVDSMHSSIENSSSKVELFTVQEWETVMKTARRIPGRSHLFRNISKNYINPAKLADLRELCKSVIPTVHHNFFEQLS